MAPYHADAAAPTARHTASEPVSVTRSSSGSCASTSLRARSPPGMSGRSSGSSSWPTVTLPTAQKYTVSAALIHAGFRYLNATNSAASVPPATRGNCIASLCSSCSATSCDSDRLAPMYTVRGAASSICALMGTTVNRVATCAAASRAYDA